MNSNLTPGPSPKERGVLRKQMSTSGFLGVRVKVCGITSLEDALAAVGAGADALGFNFHPASPRSVSIAQAAKIIRKVPPFVTTVAVFVDPTLNLVRQVLFRCRMDMLQMHGQETPEFLANFPSDKVIKAQAVRNAASLKALVAYPAVSAFLLDAYHPGLAGGTGKVFSWDLARKAQGLKKPIILAGGLNPENVADAVRQARPYAVDVASGVESAPGKKDKLKMTRFIKNAKG